MMAPFDTASMRQAVTAALEAAPIPEHERNAFALVATKDGVQAVVSSRLGDHWEVVGSVRVEYDGDLSGGVVFKASW